jgi:hypothetical protein
VAARCRSCGAPILWRTTTGGKPIPVDAEPTTDGNLVEDADGRLRHIAGPLEVEPGTPIYMPHHATCPDGKAWRRRR